MFDKTKLQQFIFISQVNYLSKRCARFCRLAACSRAARPLLNVWTMDSTCTYGQPKFSNLLILSTITFRLFRRADYVNFKQTMPDARASRVCRLDQ